MRNGTDILDIDDVARMAHVAHELIDVDARLTDAIEPDHPQAIECAGKCLPHPRHPLRLGPM